MDRDRGPARGAEAPRRGQDTRGRADPAWTPACLTSPLISPEALAERLATRTSAIADVRWFLGEPERGRREYAAGHIPGAVFVDLDRDLAAPDRAGPPSAAGSARSSRSGWARSASAPTT